MTKSWVAGAVVALVFVAGGAGAAEYTIDGAHSSAIFKVKHLGASYVYGQFTEVTGSVSFSESDPASSLVEISIPTKSLETFDDLRDRHLQGPDFFKVKEFPVMTFKSTHWEKTGDHMYRVTGDLVLLGKKKALVVEVEHTGNGKNPRSGDELAGFHTVFTIDRTDFGMNYGVVKGPGGLGKDIEVIFSVEGVKQ